MDKLDHLGWVVANSYEIGGELVGIRSTSEAFGRWVDDVLAEYRTTETAPIFYSAVVGDDATGPGRHFNILYRYSIKLIRTFDLSMLARTLLSELEFPLYPTRDDAIYSECAVVSRGGVSALVPSILLPFFAELGREVDKAGLALPPETAVAIDPGSGMVLPVDPLIRVPEGMLDRLSTIRSLHGKKAPRRRAGSNGRDASRAPVGVDVVCSIGDSEEPSEPASPATGLYRLSSHTLNFPALGGEALQGAARLVERAECRTLRAAAPLDMLRALVDVLDRTPA
jgi:hypothetical protein